MRIADALREAARQLGGDEGAAEAALLLGHALGVERAWLFAHGTEAIAPEAAARFRALLEARLAGHPVAHVVGRRGFWRFDLDVTPATLIPRPETERLVELALERLPADRPLRLLDLGTGTGAIALALAVERPRAEVVAVDASPAAAEVARRNAARLGLAARVRVREGDWFMPVAGESFDLVASNPPYIDVGDPHLDTGDLRFEPRSALASGSDGLDDLRRIAIAAPDHLKPGGWLLLEHGWRQGEAVRTLLRASGFEGVRTELDLESRERVTFGCVPLD